MIKKAPDFTLKDTQFADVVLRDIIGEKNVVILFFPFAFSSVCTKELCTVRDNMKLYDSLNAEVLGISVDSSFTLRSFKEANNLNFRLLSDFNKEVSKRFGVLYEDYFGLKGVSKRAVFVIDKKGEIIHTQILEDSENIPDFLRVQQVLVSLD